VTDLILIPGLLCDDYLWHAQALDLADQARVRIAPPPTAETIRAMAAAILDGAPERFALAGLSMGGYLCFEIMRQAPQRVERLALVDTSARDDTPEQTKTRNALITAAQSGRFRLLTREIVNGLITPQRAADDAFAGPIREMARRVGPETFVAQQRAIMGRADSRPTLTAITCPTLVICGEQDVTTPPDLAREMADHMAGAHLLLIEDCAHLSPLEQPDAVSVALGEWLSAS